MQKFLQTFVPLMAVVPMAFGGVLWLIFEAQSRNSQLLLVGGVYGLLVALAVAFAALQTAVAALFNLLAGKGACVAWVRPSTCLTLGSWLAFEWRFNSVGGMQEGIRFCGLEVATRGILR